MTLTDDDVATAYANTAQKTVRDGPMLLLALYDRLAHDVELVKRYLETKELERVDELLQHSQKIVIVLRSALQSDGFRGGQELRKLYNTLVDLLVKANLSKDPKLIEQCQVIIAPLHKAWRNAVAVELGKKTGERVSMG
jgi:flagellar protein FliS